MAAVLREVAPRRAHWQKIIESDAGPLHAIGVKQQIASMLKLVIHGDAIAEAHDEMRMLSNRYGNLRTAEKITNKLCRIVATGVLEIKKAKTSAVIAQRVVEAEVRGRYAHALRRQLGG